MTISNVSFNVRFDLTGAPKLVLTDTTGSAPAGMVGIYTITQPDGYVRTGNISSPDTVAGGVFQYNLSPDSIGGPQCGNYTIKLTVTAPGYFSTDFTRTFAFSYAPVSLSLTKNFDIFTPNLSYSDGTSYSVAGYSTGAVTRSWLSNSTPTGNLTSSGVSINLAYQGQYYDAVYTTTLTSSLVYQHTTNAWLSVSESLAKTEVASACTPKPLDELVQMLESFRNGDIDCAGETPDFDRAQILYTHLIDMLRLLLAGGIGQPGVLKVYDDFLFLVRGNQTVPCNHTNQPIPAYDFSDYEVTPFTADAAYCATFGDNVNISYLINHQLNDVCVLAQVYEVATGQQVFADLVVVDPDNVYVTLLSVPTTNQYRIVVHTGLKGLQGPPGPGFPTGGTTGQYLKKQSNANFDTVWFTPEFVTSLTGEATGTGPGATAVTLSNSAVINKVLTGLSVSSGVITQTDSILTAFGKLQGTVSSLVGGVKYAGTWNAATNSPAITSSVGVQGTYYVVSTPGSTSINGITDWKMGDWIIFNGTVWEKVDNTDAVISVNGQTGAVSLTTTNITEGTNLYYTDARARAAISLTTTGNSGAATYVNGVLNIPQYQAALTNPVTGTGTTNRIAKFTASGTIGDGAIIDNGSQLITNTADVRIGNAASTGDVSLDMGTGRTGNGNTYIDLIGDTTYTDYGLRIIRGSGGANAASSIDHRGTGLYRIRSLDAADIAFSTSSTERMRLTAAGDVGIGTTSPEGRLDINSSTASLVKGLTLTAPFLNGNNNGQSISLRSSSSTQSYAGIDMAFENLFVSFNSYLAFRTGTFASPYTERMRITASGRLLVGTTTDSGATFQVSGTMSSTQGANFATSSGGVGIGTTSSTGKLLVQGDNDQVILNTTGTWSAMYFRNGGLDRGAFYVNNTDSYVEGRGSNGLTLSGAAVANHMRITSAGNVGIGNTSPLTLLHVGAGINASLSNGAGGTFNPQLIHSITSGVAGIMVLVNDGTNNRRAGIFVDQTNAVWGLSQLETTGSIPFVIRNSGGERMRITSDGNLGLGTTSPARTLDVNGSIRIGNSQRVEFGGTTTHLAGESSSNTLFFSTNNAERMRLTSAGELLIGTTADNGAFTLQNAGGMYAGPNADNVAIQMISGTAVRNAGSQFHDYGAGGSGSMFIRGGSGLTNSLSLLNNGRAVFNGSTDAGFQVDVQGTLRSTQDAFFATSSGNVGIGVANAGTKLEVSASAITPATVSTYAVSLGNSTRQIMSLGTDADYGYIQTWGGRKLYLNNQGNDIVTNANLGVRTLSPAYTLDVAGTLRSTQGANFATSSGNVGIGTASPQARFHSLTSTGTAVTLGDGTSNLAIIQGASRTGTTAVSGSFANTLVLASHDDAISANTGASIGFHGKWNSGLYSSSAQFASIFGGKENSTDANLAGYLGFNTRPAGGNPTERMRLTSAGELLVGTTTDNGDFNLQVAGGAYLAGNASTIALQLEGGRAIRSSGAVFLDAGTGGTGGIQLRTGSGLTNALSFLNNGRAVFNGSNDGGFQVDVQGTLRSTQGANFATSSGVVRVGTESGASKLTVSGSGTLVGQFTNTDATNGFGVAIESEGTASSRYALILRNIAGTTVYGGVSTATGQVGHWGLGVSPATTLANMLTVSGGASIGASYTGNAAPSNGLLVQGNVGIGTTSPDSRLSVIGDGTGIVRIGGGAGGNTASIGLTGSISLTNYTLSGDTGNGNVDINRPTNGSIGFRMNNTSQMVLTPNGDLLIGTTTDSNGTKAIIINNGTAPTNNVTDSAQLYAADQAAGNSCLHTRTENGAVIKLYQETTGVGSATVSSPGGGNTIKTDDTFDGYTIQQIAKALRNQGLLA